MQIPQYVCKLLGTTCTVIDWKQLSFSSKVSQGVNVVYGLSALIVDGCSYQHPQRSWKVGIQAVRILAPLAIVEAVHCKLLDRMLQVRRPIVEEVLDGSHGQCRRAVL